MDKTVDDVIDIKSTNLKRSDFYILKLRIWFRQMDKTVDDVIDQSQDI